MFSKLSEIFSSWKKPKASRKVELKQDGWRPNVRKKLELIIAEGAGKQLPVVLDFDNTIVCRDVGEATFAILLQDGKISKNKIPEEFSPQFLYNNTQISLGKNIHEYYEYLNSCTAHHMSDTAREMVGYNWIVQIMQGLTPLDLANATAKAYDQGSAAHELTGAPTPEEYNLPYLRPFFYPQMVELIGVLLQNEFDVWVISSSNTWSVRWLLLNGLNPMLKEFGFEQEVQPTHVMGINTLVIGPDSRMYKDAFHVWDDQRYASMDPKVIGRYKLTALVVPPVSASYGKVSQIMQWISKTPYLVVGDSFGDLPMLRYAENRLWIARMEHPEFQQYVAPQLVKKDQKDKWMVQPVLYRDWPGFIPNILELKKRSVPDMMPIERSLEAFSSFGLIDDFLHGLAPNVDKLLE